MNHNLYCIFDRVTGLYSRFFTALNDEEAKRFVRNNFISDPSVSDYELYCVPVSLSLDCGRFTVMASSSDTNYLFVCDVVDVGGCGCFSPREYNEYISLIARYRNALGGKGVENEEQE